MLGGPFGLGKGCCCSGLAGAAAAAAAPGASGSPVVGSTSSHSDERSPELKLKPITIYTDIEQGKLRQSIRGACGARSCLPIQGWWGWLGWLRGGDVADCHARSTHWPSRSAYVQMDDTRVSS